MKKVALVVEATRGGVKKHVCDLAANLSPEKYKVYVIYGSRQSDAGWESARNALQQNTCAELIECAEMERALGRQDLRACRHLIEIFKQIKPDIVHCHSSKAGIVGRIAAKACGVRTVLYTPHDYAFQMPDISPATRKLYIAAERFLSRHATTKTISVSQGERQEAIAAGLDRPDKFVLIHNGIADGPLPARSELRRRLGLREDVYYIGTTTYCVEQKDPMTFLETARRTVEQDPCIQFVHIGDGALLGQMQAWVAEQKLEDRIHLVGFRSDAAELVGALDAYLSTSLYEGLPYSVIEAMRAGVPIILSDVVGNNELVQEGQNGYLFPPKDAAAASRLLLKQKNRNDITHEMVRATFQEEFSLDAMMAKLESVYDKAGA